jgi:hypothetical protein
MTFTEGTTRTGVTSVEVPPPPQPPRPPSGGGDDDDDDDDDDVPAPAPTPIPTVPPSVQPTPTLPVLFLPETGLREWQPGGSAVGWVLLLFGLLGVALLALVVWQKVKLR